MVDKGKFINYAKTLDKEKIYSTEMEIILELIKEIEDLKKEVLK